MSELSTHPESTVGYRLDVQALRAVAVVLVVAFHVNGALPGGFIGVDVFFVISGFVITSLLDTEWRRSGSINLRNFYSRRARRLLPTLAVVIAVVLVASALLLAPTGAQQTAAATALGATAFGSNVYLYRFGVPYFQPEHENPLIHTWSLGVEEQIYLVFPLLLILIWRLARRRKSPWRASLVGLAAVTAGSLALCVMTSFGHLPIPIPRRFAFYLPFTRLWEFSIGAMAAIATSRLPRSGRLGLSLGVAGTSLIAAGSIVFTPATVFPGVAALVPVAGTALLILAGSMSEKWVEIVSRPTLVWLGDRSYEWYLWHWPAIVLASYTVPGNRWVGLAAAVVALPLAELTRRFVGERFRHNRRIAGRRALGLAVACISAPALIAITVEYGSNRGWGVPELQAAVAAQKRSTAESKGCDSILRHEGCSFTNGEPPSVILVGDSQAAAISDMVWSTVRDANEGFGIWTRPGCPFLVGVPQSERCRSWATEVADWLQKSPPKVLLVHQAALAYTAEGSGRYTTSEFAIGVAGIEKRLAPLGTHVVFVGPVPSFEESAPDRATLIDPRPQPASKSVNQARAESAAVLRALADANSEGRFVVLDVTDVVCGKLKCSQYDDGWIYRDASHLSPLGANRLRSVVERAISDALAAT